MEKTVASLLHKAQRRVRCSRAVLTQDPEQELQKWAEHASSTATEEQVLASLLCFDGSLSPCLYHLFLMQERIQALLQHIWCQGSNLGPQVSKSKSTTEPHSLLWGSPFHQAVKWSARLDFTQGGEDRSPGTLATQVQAQAPRHWGKFWCCRSLTVSLFLYLEKMAQSGEKPGYRYISKSDLECLSCCFPKQLLNAGLPHCQEICVLVVTCSELPNGHE